MKALTIGSAMVDTIAVIASDRIEQMVMRNADTSFLLLEEGRKTDALEVSTHCGGGAVNAAVAMARLGLTVATLVKVGRDNRAAMIKERLADEGVSCRRVLVCDETPTGASVMVSSHERNAAIFTYRGANGHIRAEELDPRAFETDVVYIASLSNQSAACFPTIVSMAKRNSAFIATNPGIRQLSARTGPLLESLREIDVLVINRVEAEALVPPLAIKDAESQAPVTIAPGPEVPEAACRNLSGGGYELSIGAFLPAAVRLGPRYVVLTCGRHGAFVGSANEIHYCPALAREVVGTAGAGDAFAATFTATLAAGESCQKALQSATVNSASVIMHVDTQTGLLESPALQAQLDLNANELKVKSWSYG